MTIRPVCVKCKVEFVVAKNEVGVIEKSADGAEQAIWEADLLQCPGCGAQILAGFGSAAIMQSWSPRRYQTNVSYFREQGALYEYAHR